jgi:uncharacterized protein with HEPN domain
MHADDRTRLRHMLDACDQVAAFVEGRARPDLDGDRMLLFALIRAIEVLGEAAGRISDPTQRAHPEIPWKAIIGMRNRLIPAYFDVDPNLVWIAATQEVPMLRARVQAVMDRG